MSQEVVLKSDEADTDALLSEFFEAFPFYAEADRKQIGRAWNFLCERCAGRTHSCGKPYYLHPMRVAFILAQSEFDAECITAGLLHSVMDLGVPIEEIERNFGRAAASIIQGASKVMNLSTGAKTIQQADAIRKMLFAMADDVRVIFVKLADRLDRIRNIKNLEPAMQRALAAEVIDIWAPLADRLGMSAEKNEFEDLSLKYTNPDAFQQIKAVISQKKDERAAYLDAAVATIKAEADKAGIQVAISSRAKHFYSIYQKMRKRNKEPGELFDLLALRIICKNQGDCYTLVGIVHGLWKPLDGRFKDYIAMPKSNGYQSLHTTVMCEDRPLEIQIRTEKMHDIAEHGVASHWLYKKGMSRDLVDAKNLSIFNQVQELRTSKADGATFQDFKNDLLGDKIVVFTPKGEVKQLPAGATAIDFAYAIHSAIGEKIVGAKADGKIIPISQPLKNTQIIEILTNPQAHPTEAQMKAARTSRTRQKIHAWLSAHDAAFIERAEAAKAESERAEAVRKAKAERPRQKKDAAEEGGKKAGRVRIDGETNFAVAFAKCCRPESPDPVVGYVSRTRGIVVHRADCLTFQRIPNIERRTIPVEWDK